MTTQTPPGEPAPTNPPSEQTGARPAVHTGWRPGDPLYPSSAYRQGLFTFRFDGDGWRDAATRPTTSPADDVPGRHLTSGGDEFADFIADWHAAGRPEEPRCPTP